MSRTGCCFIAALLFCAKQPSSRSSRNKAKQATTMTTTHLLHLDLSTRGVGFTIAGGTDNPTPQGNTDLVIQHVHEDGAAKAAGLQVGDRLLAVNGKCLLDLNHTTAVDLIRDAISAQFVTLWISRKHSHSDSDEDTASDNLNASPYATTSPTTTTTTTATTTAETPATATTATEAAAAAKTASRRHARCSKCDASTDGGTGLDMSLCRERWRMARRAYRKHDPELSRLAHELDTNPELHKADEGQYIKAAVFGGLDGIITTFATVASVTGANLSIGVVIIMGFANLIGDGLSMGVGEYLSAQSELQYAVSERNREEWEFDNNPSGEVREMLELYRKRGFSTQDAMQAISVMVQHPDFFIDHMMVEELGLMPPDTSVSPARKGLVMFTAFVVFGLIPLLSYLVLSSISFGGHKNSVLFGIACALTALALFTLGAVKSRYIGQRWYVSGLTMLANGSVAATAAFLVGYGLDFVVSDTEC
ncbi:vacuolar iron family transporter [Salpingoeca rosetta]|uniref:Vacuolar iron family transporter n=1 Tax=Salpingoeca rosetta (strain ATCC 50818 / BSB-021) TaxID=946362 RepID=F2UP56_SALR5|nr:vacuolar iron family transporter [Salpingoeca rosetta]EGD79411.1 vacuolar iron family transporter [Salpingoeca rosetta]|eukprot:XP_004989180.1 vacuolar iron family transporter [Salpingoeca rosetta]